MSGPVRPKARDLQEPLVISGSSEGSETSLGKHEEAYNAECRICLESGSESDLIAPCFCSGTSEHVHRSCLNRWRAIKQNPRAFTHCGTCGFEYRLNLQRTEEDKDKGFLGRKSKFRLLMARDVFVGFACIQMVVIAAALLFYFADSARELPKQYGSWIYRDDCVEGDYEKGGRCSKGFERIYYGAGLVAIFCLIGGMVVVSMCISVIRSRNEDRCRCCNDCCGDSDTLYLWWLLDPTGGSAGCDSCMDNEGLTSCCADSECCVGVIVVLIFFIFLLIIVGAIAAFFLGVYALQRAVQRHQSVLHKSLLAKEYIVLDRSEWIADMESAGLLSSGVEQQAINRSVINRSAPAVLAALETSLSWSSSKHGGISVSLGKELFLTQ
jgi:hypothetical protein